MDTLNFISWIENARLVTTIDPAKTLLPVAVEDPRRDDNFIIGAITIEDLASQLEEN